MRKVHMKEMICGAAGVIGAAISSMFGGWSAGLTTLLVFMAVDYVSGLLLAGVFKKSSKTKSGALSSKACMQGLAKKGMMLLVVLVACRLDLMLGSNYVRDGSVIAFCTSEMISIIENAGMMGVPVPEKIKDAIEILKKKSEN